MALAQQLYEGLDIAEEELAGLITYMRTDDINVAESALDETRAFIKENYDAEYLPEKVRVFSKKVKGAQEGHEAIRPTSINREPSAVKPYLNDDQYKLYELIWNRMVASQMSEAKQQRTTATIEAVVKGSNDGFLIRATSTETIFKGFWVLYSENEDSDENTEKGKLPVLEKGTSLRMNEIFPEQHFTQPPGRYNEASLVKALEERGIGRPSTYAPTISNIQRHYIKNSHRAFVPEQAANIVTDLLVEFFPEIINETFTSNIETKLDEISAGNKEWTSLLKEFWEPFNRSLEYAQENMPKVRIPDEVTTEICPICLEKYGIIRNLVIKNGSSGIFLSCPNHNDTEYPCSYTQPYRIHTRVKCPMEGCDGELLELMSRRGRKFYGCSNYPECVFRTNKRPVVTPCPACGGLLVEQSEDRLKCLGCSKIFPITSEEE